MTRRDFALLVLILLIGSAITIGQKVRHGGLPCSVRVEGLEFLRGPLHTSAESHESPITPGAKVTIDAGGGDVQVVPWGEPKVRAELKKQIHRESEREASEVSSALKLEVAPESGGVTVRTSGSRPDGLDTTLVVMVPEASGVSVITDRGSVTASGVKGDVLLKTSHGDVEASDLKGRLEVVNTSGAIELRRVRGPVVIRTAHGDVDGADLEGTVDVAAQSGEVTLSRVGGEVTATHSHGSLELSEVRAGARISGTGGEVKASGVRGPLEITGEHGSVTVERAGGDVRLTVPHCDVTLADIAGNLTATIEAEPLEAVRIKGSVKVQSSASEVSLKDIQGPIVVSATHTPVEIIRPGSDVEVTTTNQGIEISGPAAKGFRIDARSDEGEVDTDLQALHLPGDRPSHFAGSVGDGKVRYRLSTTHSTISILTTSDDTSHQESE